MPRRSKNDDANAAEAIIEKHISEKIRLRRGLLGMSQVEVAKELGITFQQFQKYERATNRVSLGKLYRMTHLLGVPVQYFFDGLAVPESTGQSALQWQDTAPESLSRQEHNLVRSFRKASPEVAQAITILLNALSQDAEGRPQPPGR